MRKGITYVALFVFLAGLAVVGFAKTAKNNPAAVAPKVNLEVVSGPIVSIDVVKKEIVVKDAKTGVEKTITVTKSRLRTLKVGETVEVILKAGSNTAEKVKKLPSKK